MRTWTSFVTLLNWTSSWYEISNPTQLPLQKKRPSLSQMMYMIHIFYINNIRHITLHARLSRIRSCILGTPGIGPSLPVYRIENLAFRACWTLMTSMQQVGVFLLLLLLLTIRFIKEIFGWWGNYKWRKYMWEGFLYNTEKRSASRRRIKPEHNPSG